MARWGVEQRRWPARDAISPHSGDVQSQGATTMEESPHRLLEGRRRLPSSFFLASKQLRTEIRQHAGEIWKSS